MSNLQYPCGDFPKFLQQMDRLVSDLVEPGKPDYLVQQRRMIDWMRLMPKRYSYNTVLD